ncbi:glucose-6-phosphate dehydrogenase [Mycobacterium persicum]|uniref:Glucose-6-phosphate 1-dehydrogenase n=1 Tax=Mycobacterium persicum TaxID=1487726 RepID=A0A8E2IP11_9MYCO|nr:glucose-6-phosphate dehydrogenase [Mycobacterium persicum]ORB48383.1 glucose-6-phosphate dehydrogenase [Mycobacterium persicum]ORB89099.1 glucose-6-phosphate dehydrogenase [Mycobacterium persicum]ORB94467.1 glucose-6-phosphate dehydrogenase [Mycobacterium persicum]ORC01155.1 glucose-6-phosphate dehydrogenase [Mycobacterium persicum]ORC06550.1 glucose-6-phosphate dehydrogenase [Mycobacterium persicum]
MTSWRWALAGSASSASDVLVIFGITGDLARKMTFRALYRLERRGLLDCPIVGVASDDIPVDKLVERAREAIGQSGEKFDDKVFGRLASRLSYLSGDVTDSALYTSLAKQIGSGHRPLYYLEMPPALFAPIVENLAAADLVRGARVAVEKPFGHDLASARELNSRLRAVLDEEQILRVDHFLGKQPVVELQYLRFANRGLAELWDSKSISEIHVTMAENFGVEDRGSFYDAVGALRDVVQNHLLQVLALVTMEPPVGASADDLNDKKAEVFRAMPALEPARYVRGQYRGYGDVAGVAQNSQTETYVALRTEIDNWRWAGVPIFLRAGKALPEKVTEVRMFLHHVPGLAFLPNRRPPEPNQIVLRIDPDPGMRLQISAHTHNAWQDIHLDSSFAEDLGEPIRPYERLLHAGLQGDRQLFAREDSIEETWRIVQPVLDNPGDVHQYDRGSWGPEAAQTLLRGHRGWQQPWLPRGAKTGQ